MTLNSVMLANCHMSLCVCVFFFVIQFLLLDLVNGDGRRLNSMERWRLDDFFLECCALMLAFVKAVINFHQSFYPRRFCMLCYRSYTVCYQFAHIAHSADYSMYIIFMTNINVNLRMFRHHTCWMTFHSRSEFWVSVMPWKIHTHKIQHTQLKVLIRLWICFFTNSSYIRFMELYWQSFDARWWMSSGENDTQ